MDSPIEPQGSGREQRERKKFLLRLDPEVYQAIQRWADDELRSVNAQVEYALRLALRQAGREVRPGRAVRRGRPSRPPTARSTPDGDEPDTESDG